MTPTKISALPQIIDITELLETCDDPSYEPDLQPVRSDEVLRSAASRFWRHPSARGRHITLAGDHEPVQLLTDPALLGRVLGSLLTATLTACADGQTVTLSCGRSTAGVWFSVHRPGADLEKADQDQTWEGRRAKRLCERCLGGRISCSADPATGTALVVTLPVGGL